jgi:hypothetical protein
MFAVAALEATSVTTAVMTQTITKIANCGSTFKPSSCIPSHSERPETFTPSESANPPPKKYKH